MVLMSCTFGLNIFSIFNIYKQTSAKNMHYTLEDINLAILWSAIYSFPTLMVIFVGAVLSQQVRKSVEKSTFLFTFHCIRKGRKTGVNIYKTIAFISDKQTIKEVSLLLHHHHIYHCTVKMIIHFHLLKKLLNFKFSVYLLLYFPFSNRILLMLNVLYITILPFILYKID